jgi:hypothetical protein
MCHFSSGTISFGERDRSLARSRLRVVVDQPPVAQFRRRHRDADGPRIQINLAAP